MTTDDGGAHWRALDGVENPQGVSVVGESSMFVLGNGELYYSTDGRKTWSRRALDIKGLYCIRFVSEKVGWIGGYVNQTGAVFQTIDGGMNWHSGEGITSNGIADIGAFGTNLWGIGGNTPRRRP